MKQVSLIVALLLAVGGASYWLGTTRSTAAPSSAVASPQAKTPGPGAPGGAQPASAPVEAMKVAQVSLPQSITAVGSLRSDEAVILRPEVAGRISEILFKEGQRVSKGQVLVRFDSSVQRAELAQAKANLSLNQSKFERAVDLFNKGFISSQARDEAENNFRIAQASADLSAARLAKLELKAPFSGVVGLRLASIGDYVKDGQDIANLEEIDQLKVDFRVPEIFLRQVATGQSLQITLDALPKERFDGKILAINPLLDTNGRAIVIRAVVANNKGQLRPGMFARVLLLIDEVQTSLMVAEQALIPVGDDFFVARVVDGRAQRVKVEIGQRRGGMVEITRGVQAEDTIVVAGQLKVRDGAPVKVAMVNPPSTLSPTAAKPPAANGQPAPAKS